MSEKTIRHEIVDLPSKGLLYSEDDPLHEGTIKLKYATAAEEDILTSTNLIKNKTVVDEFLKAVIITPNIDLNKMLIGDKNAIAFAARIMAYGKDYNIINKCPVCGASNKETIDLNLLDIKKVDYNLFKDGENSFEFKLPNSENTITFKLLTHKDVSEIDSTLKNYKKMGFDSGGSKEVTTRLRKTITAIDGDDNRKNVNIFVNDMLAKDTHAFRTYIEKISPDIDTRYRFECKECGHEEVIDIPIDVEFFWPSTRI